MLALPYHLTVTYAGLVTLMFMYLPSGIDSVYPERNMQVTLRATF